MQDAGPSTHATRVQVPPPLPTHWPYPTRAGIHHAFVNSADHLCDYVLGQEFDTDRNVLREFKCRRPRRFQELDDFGDLREAGHR